MPDYDTKKFTPPAPVARVTISTRDRARSVSDVPMLIDSGADATFIPKTCVDQLGLRAERREGCFFVGFDGSTSAADIVDAEMLFLGRTFHGQFAATDDEIGIVGRNILNHLSLVLDGPGVELA